MHFRNFMQMADQRVAHVSQILLAPGKCTLPLNEAQAHGVVEAGDWNRP